MAIYVFRRLLGLVPTLLGVSVIVFLLLRVMGDPTALLLPPDASEQQRAAFRAELGLDQPLPLQFLNFLWNLVQGDLGPSFSFNQPALQVVLDRMPATVLLAGAAMLITVLVGIPVGLLAALNRNRLWARGSMGLVLLAQAVPTFWLGIVLIYVFGVYLDWFPISGIGDGSWRYFVLPSITLAAFMAALTTRLTRSEMLDVMHQDYLRTARAKGLPQRRIVGIHALRNSLVPIVTVLGLQLGNVLAGAIVTEAVFQWPGVGSLLVRSIEQRDYPVVQAAVLVIAVVYVVVNLVTDLLYGVIDPRIRVSEADK
ncbi:ABC transporter permease [Kribbella sp. NPDC050820]|uniref:ABC transporter permease n=1 Tax=Kribbella sp. NPDC050820 TaxID=3155408 RepID=UPI0033F1F75C